MPLPLLVPIILGGVATLGVGKGIKAAVDQKDANDTNRLANSIADDAVKAANLAREKSGEAITELGNIKVSILDESVKPFIETFEKIHNIELIETQGINELNSFKLDKNSFAELKSLQTMATSLLGGAAGGATLGAITAFGAYSGAMAFGAASTGTAIASLSGAAATNATLAFLGGGSLAAGGLGIAGGTMVLGGLIAAPALAVMGFVMGAKASANNDRAYANLAKAREYRQEMQTVITLCRGIRLRANMFQRLLLKLNALFAPAVYELEQIIKESGTDFSTYTSEQKAKVGVALSLAGAIKSVLDTAILTEDGSLTEESAQIEAKVNPLLIENA